MKRETTPTPWIKIRPSVLGIPNMELAKPGSILGSEGECRLHTHVRHSMAANEFAETEPI
jgi:hypothetical protein